MSQHTLHLCSLLLVALTAVSGAAADDSFDHPADAVARFVEHLPRLVVDDAKATAAGIRKLAGRHITLYTDLPAAPDVDELPQVFDAAVAQFCPYFGLDPSAVADWRMTGFLIKDRDLFRRLGVIPPDVPNFKYGFSRNFELWLYEQPSKYYRRHLLIHEGVHGFMNTQLGGCGPPWFMEGLAELLSTHHWADGQLRLGSMPRAKEEVPEWGRIKIIKDEVAARRALRLDVVADLRPVAYLDNPAYGWSWAAATLLDGHPRYRDRFRSLQKHVLSHDFNEQFRRLFADDWQQLNEEWQLFVTGIEYGYDVERGAVAFGRGKPFGDRAVVTVAADRSWQSSGLVVEARKRYRLEARGRYQIGREPKVWWCEPGGISIHYWQGRPLGQLLVAVRPDDPPKDSLSALLKPSAVGLATTLTPEHSGTLYFKINEPPDAWSDNAGELRVEVTRE